MCISQVASLENDTFGKSNKNVYLYINICVHVKILIVFFFSINLDFFSRELTHATNESCDTLFKLNPYFFT